MFLNGVVRGLFWQAVWQLFGWQLHTFIVDQELGSSRGRGIKQDAHAVGSGQVDGGQSSLSSTDHSPVLSDIITFTNDDQWIGAVCSAARRPLPVDLRAGDGLRLVVDGEIDKGDVDALMRLNTDESWSLWVVGGDSVSPDTAWYNSRGCWWSTTVVWRHHISCIPKHYLHLSSNSCASSPSSNK